jgi:Flp pilus assembly secretin CpaC
VKQVFVEDAGICRVVLTAQNEVSVIGRSVGTTRVAIKADGKNGEEVTIIQVRTAPTWDLPIATSEDDFEQLSITVHEMFPDSKINIVRNKDDSMIVAGIVPDELTAVKIMTFIRRVCLVPIRDMVIVQPNRR